MNSKTKIIVVLMIATLSVCCSPSLYKPTAVDVEAGKKLYADLTMEQLNKGLRLYADKCGSCHALYKPREITPARWKEMLPEMKTKAQLTDKEYDLITRYLKCKNATTN